MRVSCKVIEDLLPLYIDGVCSEESKKMIKNHLGQCHDCKVMCKSLKKDINIEQTEIDKNLESIKPFKKLKMKKNLSIVSTVVAVVLIFSLVLVFIYGYSPKDPMDSVLVPVDFEGGDLQAISEKLFDDYLRYHKSYKVDMFERIRDYDISLVIAEGERNAGQYRFTVEYSVKLRSKIGPEVGPYKEGNHWIAGNGDIDGNWIRDSYAFVTVVAEEGHYRIVAIGTGP